MSSSQSSPSCQCMICSAEDSQVEDPITLPYCGHIFCRLCIWKWSNKQNTNGITATCPNCTGSLAGIRLLELVSHPQWNEYQPAQKWYDLYQCWSTCADNLLQIQEQDTTIIDSCRALARKYLVKCANQNYCEAQYQLYIHLKDDGKTSVEAEQWLQKAARNGHTVASSIILDRHNDHLTYDKNGPFVDIKHTSRLSSLHEGKRKYHELTNLLKTYDIVKPPSAKLLFIQDSFDTFSYVHTNKNRRKLSDTKKRAQLAQHWEGMSDEQKRIWYNKQYELKKVYEDQKFKWLEEHPQMNEMYNTKKKIKRTHHSNQDSFVPLVPLVV